ncbi:FmdE family protein [Nitrosophilus labii]|uniref:FmdE family protein n=1 Tax=Nitrosophilus labii TaxID=2706014 RepID=UPI001656DFFB|nr:FmdE family protein [Nitrosophilus labii]
MNYPEFFKKVEPILLYDPLADFLGAVENGEIEINYLDVVKFAGHSCPTVAGAYLMTKLGLKKLYGDSLPVRGEIKIMVKGAKNEGVEGVIGNTIAFICGVSEEGGFKGIGGKFNRANKLLFSQDIPKEIRLQRTDNGTFVDISYAPTIAPDPRQQQLMQKIMTNQATKEEKDLFKKLWQERVKKILLSKEKWAQMVDID